MTTRTNPRNISGWPYDSPVAHDITQAMVDAAPGKVLAVHVNPQSDDPIQLADAVTLAATHLVDRVRTDNCLDLRALHGLGAVSDDAGLTVGADYYVDSANPGHLSTVPHGARLLTYLGSASAQGRSAADAGRTAVNATTHPDTAPFDLHTTEAPHERLIEPDASLANAPLGAAAGALATWRYLPRSNGVDGAYIVQALPDPGIVEVVAATYMAVRTGATVGEWIRMAGLYSGGYPSVAHILQFPSAHIGNDRLLVADDTEELLIWNDGAGPFDYTPNDGGPGGWNIIYSPVATEDLRPRYLAEPVDSGAAAAQGLTWLDPATGYPEGLLNETILVWADSTLAGDDLLAGTVLRAKEATDAGIAANWIATPRTTDYVYDNDATSLKPLSHQQVAVELRKIREVVTTERIAPVGTRFNAGGGPVKFGARVALPVGTERYMKPDVDIWMRASLVSNNQNMFCEVWPAGADHGDIAQRIAVSNPTLLPNTHERSYPFTFAGDVALPDNLTQVDIVAVMHDRTAHRYGLGAYVQAFGRAISINALNVITVAPGLLYGIGGVTFESLSLKGLPGGHVPEARAVGQVLMATGTGIEDHEFADLPVSPADAAAPLDVARDDYGVGEAFLLHLPAAGDYVDVNGVTLENDTDVFFLVPGGGAPGVADAANPTPAEVATLNAIEGTGTRGRLTVLSTAYRLSLQDDLTGQQPGAGGGEAKDLLAGEIPNVGDASTSQFLVEIAPGVFTVAPVEYVGFIGMAASAPTQPEGQTNGVLVKVESGTGAGLYHLRAGVLTRLDADTATTFPLVTAWDNTKTDYQQGEWVATGGELFVSNANQTAVNDPSGDTGEHWTQYPARRAYEYSILADQFSSYQGTWADLINYYVVERGWTVTRLEADENAVPAAFDFNNDANPITLAVGESVEYDGAQWIKAVTPASVTLKRAQTDKPVDNRNCGWHAGTTTFTFDSASGDIPYEPATGLWGPLEPGVFRLAGVHGFNNMDNTEYCEYQWFDEAGSGIDQNWVANGSALGGAHAIQLGQNFPGWADNPLCEAIITVTSPVRVRLSLVNHTGGFDSQQFRSWQSITQLATHSLLNLDPALVTIDPAVPDGATLVLDRSTNPPTLRAATDATQEWNVVAGRDVWTAIGDFGLQVHASPGEQQFYIRRTNADWVIVEATASYLLLSGVRNATDRFFANLNINQSQHIWTSTGLNMGNVGDREFLDFSIQHAATGQRRRLRLECTVGAGYNNNALKLIESL